jgi:hypothetical protein
MKGFLLLLPRREPSMSDEQLLRRETFEKLARVPIGLAHAFSDPDIG